MTKNEIPQNILLEALMASPQPTIICDSFGKIISGNKAAAQIFSIAEADLGKKDIFEVLSFLEINEYNPNKMPNWHQLKQGVKNLEVFCHTRNNMGRHCMLSVSAIAEEQFFALYFMDITGLRQIEGDLMESRQKYRAIIDEAGDGIITIDDRGTILMVNKSMEKLFGYVERDLLGQNVSLIMPQPYKKEHDQYLANYHKTGRAKIIGIGREVLGQRKNGTTFPILLNVTKVSLKDKTLYSGIIHDLSNLKLAQAQLKEYASELVKLNSELEYRVNERTEQLNMTVAELEMRNEELNQLIEAKEAAQSALKENQEFLQSITEQFPEGFIAVFDEHENCLLLEGKELVQLAQGLEIASASDWKDKLSVELHKQIIHYKQEVFLGDEVTREIYMAENYYLLNLSQITQEENHRNRLLLVGKNITSQKEAQLNALKALSKEKKLNELKSRFMTMASHEFRTPLATIQSSASLIARYAKEDQQQHREKHINRIKSSVSNVNQVLTEFISLEKLQEGILKLKPESFDVEEVCLAAVEQLNPLLKTEQVIHYSHTGNSVFRTDVQLLTNILINLLSNAVKYSEEGSNISFTSHCSQEKLGISVTDEGIGISDEDQKHLFEWFFRGDNVATIQGTGIGLYIVKKYTELMGGKISFHSKLGEGTTFQITFKPVP